MALCQPRFALLALFGVLGPALPAAAQRPAAPPTAKAAALAQAASASPAAATPEQMPAQPPQVTYRDGQLTIVARNSRLSDILNAVRSRTGASLDMPPETAQERIAMQLGPAPAPEVLSDLLDGSRFDYVILGSPQDPSALVTLILTRRSAAEPASAAQASPAPQPEPDDQPEILPEEPPPMTAPPPAAQNPPRYNPQIFPQPAGVTPNMGQPMPPDQAAQPGNPETPAQPGQPDQQQQIKTPQQLLQELRQMQMQQQQRQQQNQPQN